MSMQRKDYVGSLSALSVACVTAVVGNTITINGLVYTGVTGTKSDDTEFSVDTDDTATATDLADSISGDVRVGQIVATITATSNAGVVTVSSTSVVSASSSDSATLGLSASKTVLLSLASNVLENNKTLKQVNSINTPYSVQATGADKQDNRVNQIIDVTAFNTIVARDRVLWGNREGYIKSVVASTSLVFTWLDKDLNEVNTTKTMAEVIASGSLVILNEDF